MNLYFNLKCNNILLGQEVKSMDSGQYWFLKSDIYDMSWYKMSFAFLPSLTESYWFLF